MKGKVGAATSIYHTRLPHQWKLERMEALELSKEALLRLMWVDHYHEHGNARATCRKYGISPTTFYRWKRRFSERGLRGLESLSRAPKSKRAPQIPWQTVDLVVKIRKRYPAWSKHKIAVILSRDHGITMSASSVGRILSRRGLYEKRGRKTLRKAARARAAKRRAERWMKSAYPGSLVQVDTKHLSYGGHSYYQFTAVDCLTRLGFCRVYPSTVSKNGADFLARLAEFMPFSINAVQSDNGSEYLGDFETAASELGMDHYFTYPHCPKQNGRVERKILSSELEFWDWNAGYNTEELNRLVSSWNHTYNLIRPHQNLGYLTPVEYLNELVEGSKQKGKVSTMS